MPETHRRQETNPSHDGVSLAYRAYEGRSVFDFERVTVSHMLVGCHAWAVESALPDQPYICLLGRSRRECARRGYKIVK